MSTEIPRYEAHQLAREQLLGMHSVSATDVCIIVQDYVKSIVIYKPRAEEKAKAAPGFITGVKNSRGTKKTKEGSGEGDEPKSPEEEKEGHVVGVRFYLRGILSMCFNGGDFNFSFSNGNFEGNPPPAYLSEKNEGTGFTTNRVLVARGAMELRINDVDSALQPPYSQLKDRIDRADFLERMKFLGFKFVEDDI